MSRIIDNAPWVSNDHRLLWRVFATIARWSNLYKILILIVFIGFFLFAHHGIRNLGMHRFESLQYQVNRLQAQLENPSPPPNQLAQQNWYQTIHWDITANALLQLLLQRAIINQLDVVVSEITREEKHKLGQIFHLKLKLEGEFLPLSQFLQSFQQIPHVLLLDELRIHQQENDLLGMAMKVRFLSRINNLTIAIDGF